MSHDCMYRRKVRGFFENLLVLLGKSMPPVPVVPERWAGFLKCNRIAHVVGLHVYTKNTPIAWWYFLIGNNVE